MKRPLKIAIIGGGLTGLAASTALRSADPSAELELFEKNGQLGGLAAGFKESGWSSSLECFYHHVFESDRFITKYAKLWNRSDRLVYRSVRTVVETSRGAFVRFDSPLALLRYPGLGLLDKLRMGLCLAYLKESRSYSSFERHLAHDWCERWMGKKAFAELWQPLLASKFGEENVSRINLAWIAARLAVRTPRLGTFTGGFQCLIDGAEAHLGTQRVKFHLNCGELRVRRTDGGLRIARPGGEEQEFDAVLVAAAPTALLTMAGELIDAGTASAMRATRALGAQVVILSCKRPLSREGNYWSNLKQSPTQPFIVAVEHTHLARPGDFNGEHIVYLGRYVDPVSEDWSRPVEKLHEAALNACRRIDPSFEAADVLRHWTFKAPYAQPVFGLNASKNLLPIRVPGVRGLYLACMSQVYPWDRGTNFALELGERAAGHILADFD